MSSKLNHYLENDQGEIPVLLVNRLRGAGLKIAAMTRPVFAKSTAASMNNRIFAIKSISKTHDAYRSN